MPPRHTYWTIILEGKPTAFRAHTREELAPTLRQLQARHPDAVLMWFARGRLWDSQEQERAANTRGAGGREKRGPGWRPGGSHQDPRERFKIPRDEKRRRFADRARRDRFDQRDRPPQEGERPAWNRDRKPGRPQGARPEWKRDERDERPGGQDRRPPGQPFRPGGDRPRGPAGPPRDRHDQRPEGQTRRPFGKEFRPGGDRPRGPGRPPRDRREGGEPRGPQDKRDWKPGPPGGKGGPHRERRPFRPPDGRGPAGGGDRRSGGWGKPGGGGGSGRSGSGRGGGGRGGGGRGGGGGGRSR